jgi:hypothetical protein
MTPLDTMYDIKRANADAGQHWFEPGALRFFRSRIGDTVYPAPAQRVTYFVSSEQFVGSRGDAAPRKYSIRKVYWGGWYPDGREHVRGDVDTAGEFQAYDSGSTARRHAAAMAANQCSEPTWENQLQQAANLLTEKGRAALDNPHGMIGRTCKCGTCFSCAAAQLVKAYNDSME